MAACASCKQPIKFRVDQFSEKLEYVHSNKVRLRSITLRSICRSCATRIADNAEVTDHPGIAALEVVTKLRAYMERPDDMTWAPVARAMTRYMASGEQQALDV